ncbi:Gfo/Idh/MocA family protein [Deinococcus marmoris]|uniref:Gfo/Idh/MocA family protein n=1 Tax=Deinococcus marmoris TaxID=249408 RepID=UPI00096AAF8D|nr:Gfo/Idh/MocA family oxidoreductase [Deinococcus marmoris]
MTKMRNIGIIGVNAERGWAAEAYVPAIQALAGLELVAVATHNQTSADAAAFGVPRAEADALIADPDIDLVTVASSVLTHHELLLAGLNAGKRVLTEWPVDVVTAQTKETAAASWCAGPHESSGGKGRAAAPGWRDWTHPDLGSALQNRVTLTAHLTLFLTLNAGLNQMSTAGNQQRQSDQNRHT